MDLTTTKLSTFVSEHSVFNSGKENLDKLVGRINGKFSRHNWSPIRYIYGCIPQSELAGFYRDADVALITPLRDGMNLVAKEFVACRTRDPGEKTWWDHLYFFNETELSIRYNHRRNEERAQGVPWAPPIRRKMGPIRSKWEKKGTKWGLFVALSSMKIPLVSPSFDQKE